MNKILFLIAAVLLIGCSKYTPDKFVCREYYWPDSPEHKYHDCVIYHNERVGGDYVRNCENNSTTCRHWFQEKTFCTNYIPNDVWICEAHRRECEETRWQSAKWMKSEFTDYSECVDFSASLLWFTQNNQEFIDVKV